MLKAVIPRMRLYKDFKPNERCGSYLAEVYSEKATKFCKISTLLLSTVHTDKIKVEILQNLVAFSEYLNFRLLDILLHVPILSR